jgi:hypothetical protein
LESKTYLQDNIEKSIIAKMPVLPHPRASTLLGNELRMTKI